jgi:hypothetical protein
MRGEVGVWLRRESVCSSHFETWKSRVPGPSGRLVTRRQSASEGRVPDKASTAPRPTETMSAQNGDDAIGARTHRYRSSYRHIDRRLLQLTAIRVVDHCRGGSRRIGDDCRHISRPKHCPRRWSAWDCPLTQ